jgi:hypothetical protein
MKVATNQLPIWFRPIAPEPKPNVFEKIKERITDFRNVHALKQHLQHRTPAESPVKKEALKQVADAPIDVVNNPVPEGWEGGREFNCGEQKSRTLSPRRKTTLSRRNLR